MTCTPGKIGVLMGSFELLRLSQNDVSAFTNCTTIKADLHGTIFVTIVIKIRDDFPHEIHDDFVSDLH